MLIYFFALLFFRAYTVLFILSNRVHYIMHPIYLKLEYESHIQVNQNYTKKFYFHVCFKTNPSIKIANFVYKSLILLPLQLLHEGVVTKEDFFEPECVNVDAINGVHKKSYWERLLKLDLNRKEIQRIGFPLSMELIERELRIIQGTIDGAEIAFEKGIAFNIAGGTHHAGSDWGEGFCLLNDQAIAAHHLIKNHSLKFKFSKNRHKNTVDK